MRKAGPEINKLSLWHHEQNSVLLLLPNLLFISPQGSRSECPGTLGGATSGMSRGLSMLERTQVGVLSLIRVHMALSLSQKCLSYTTEQVEIQ